jgi:hypothetical protein
MSCKYRNGNVCLHDNRQQSDNLLIYKGKFTCINVIPSQSTTNSGLFFTIVRRKKSRSYEQISLERNWQPLSSQYLASRLLSKTEGLQQATETCNFMRLELGLSY